LQPSRRCSFVLFHRRNPTRRNLAEQEQAQLFALRVVQPLEIVRTIGISII
jgi:hypothetical protein